MLVKAVDVALRGPTGQLRRQHLVLLMAVALGGVVARDDQELLLLWRVELSTLYGIAGLAKVNESFLGGGVLARAVAGAPLGGPVPSPLLLVLAGLGVIAVEAFLAVTPWVPRLRRTGLAVAAGLHTLSLVLVGVSPLVALRLVVFGGTAVLLHATSAGLLVPAAPAPGRRGLPWGRWRASQHPRCAR